MYWAIVFVLLVLWLTGWVIGIMGNWIHVLLLVAVVVGLLAIINTRKL